MNHDTVKNQNLNNNDYFYQWPFLKLMFLYLYMKSKRKFNVIVISEKIKSNIEKYLGKNFGRIQQAIDS